MKMKIFWQDKKSIKSSILIIRYGSNELPSKSPKLWILHLFEALSDTILIILIISSMISLVLGIAFPKAESERPFGWIEGFAIIAAVLIVAVVTATNNWKQERQFQRLNKNEKNQNVQVIRTGVTFEIQSNDILVGDIVQLNTGAAIPADGLFIEGFDFKVDESTMTGESVAQSKDTKGKSVLLSGCQVAEGTGKMLVLAVGENSQWGQTVAKLNEPHESTPLQKRLKNLALTIGRVGIGFAVSIFVIKTVGWLIEKLTSSGHGNPFVFNSYDSSVIVSNLVLAVTTIVVSVPEGLPLAVTISLSYSVDQMMKENQLVRHLTACEVMGGATTICSDKTGTLTQNKMTVVAGYFGGKFYRQEEGVPGSTMMSEVLTTLIEEGVSVNSTADIGEKEIRDPIPHNFIKKLIPGFVQDYKVTIIKDIIGNKTEGALLKMVNDNWKKDYAVLREEFKPVCRTSFSSLRKRMSTIIKKDENYIMHVKGAGEIIIGICTKYMNDKGEILDLTREKKQEMLDTVEEIAKQGMRTLSLGFKNLGPEELSWSDVSELDLIFTCLVGIEDPIRPEVPDAVKACADAGIMVRMVTGDNKETSKKIAQQCGIYGVNPKGIAMEGPDFRALYETDKAKFYEMLPNLEVLSRSSPEDKYILVGELKRCGEIVAVTGDGTNDGPALKRANVGLAMGSGTSVAKEAADIIILDDNFATIVTACKWGRGIYENIRKFLQFQLTVNIVALSLLMLTAIVSFFFVQADGTSVGMPLAAIQLLWLNLIMNTFAALALATERPDESLLLRPPHGTADSLITDHMAVAMIGQAMYQLVFLLFLYFFGVTVGISRAFYFEGELIYTASTTNNCLVFNTFVWCQIFNQWNARRIFRGQWNIFSGLLKNYTFLVISVFTMVVQVAFVELGRIPVVNFILHTTGLDYIQWPVAIFIGFMCVPFHFAVIKPIQLLFSPHGRKTVKKVGVYQSFTDKKKKH